MTTREPSYPIIISGAGSVGLALALGLARHGIRSLVLEKKSELDPHSRALGILARTLEIFRSWGVLEHFLAQGVWLSRVPLWTVGASAPSGIVDLSALAEISPAPGFMVLPQDRTEAILLDHVRACGFSDIRFGCKLNSFREDADGVIVEAAAQDGQPFQLMSRYLIGCDGARSTVRSQLGWQLEGRTYPIRILIADVQLADERDQLPWPRFAPQRRGALAALRYRPGFWRIIATLADGESDENALRNAPEKVERLFGAGPFETVWSSVFSIHCRTSPHFRRGRILLAGDAAHINSPAGGQGMNSGIQDAHNLAWKLARILDADQRAGYVGAEALLSSYEQERRPFVINNVDRFTNFLTQNLLLAHPYRRALVLRLMQLALRSPLPRRRIAIRAQMLDARYRSSSLISGHGPLLGARAPDGELRDARGNTLWLSDLCKRDAVLVCFDDAQLPSWNTDELRLLLADVPHLLVVRIVRNVAPDRGHVPQQDSYGCVSTRLWTDWHARHGLIALIRPDGHIGWSARQPAREALAAGIKKALGVAHNPRSKLPEL